MPIENSSRNPYDLQNCAGLVDFVAILLKQRDINYTPVKID